MMRDALYDVLGLLALCTHVERRCAVAAEVVVREGDLALKAL